MLIYQEFPHDSRHKLVNAHLIREKTLMLNPRAMQEWRKIIHHRVQLSLKERGVHKWVWTWKNTIRNIHKPSSLSTIQDFKNRHQQHGIIPATAPGKCYITYIKRAIQSYKSALILYEINSPIWKIKKYIWRQNANKLQNFKQLEKLSLFAF